MKGCVASDERVWMKNLYHDSRCEERDLTMNKENEKTPLWKENAEVLTKTVMLNEDELQRVSGGDGQQSQPADQQVREKEIKEQEILEYNKVR